MNPVILVFTTYCLDPESAAEIRKSQADGPAGDVRFRVVYEVLG